jgi:hypothetical protein
MSWKCIFGHKYFTSRDKFIKVTTNVQERNVILKIDKCVRCKKEIAYITYFDNRKEKVSLGHAKDLFDT